MKKTGLFQNETLFSITYIAHNGQIYKTTAPPLIFVGSCGTDGSHLSTFYRTPPIANYAEVKKKVENAIRFCYKNGQRFFYVGGAIGLIP